MQYGIHIDTVVNNVHERRKRSWPISGTIPVFVRMDWEPRKTSVKIAGVAAEIRTEHLPNISLERYPYTILLCLLHFNDILSFHFF
jgi:hypothetical protein